MWKGSKTEEKCGNIISIQTKCCKIIRYLCIKYGVVYQGTVKKIKNTIPSR